MSDQCNYCTTIYLYVCFEVIIVCAYLGRSVRNYDS